MKLTQADLDFADRRHREARDEAANLLMWRALRRTFVGNAPGCGGMCNGGRLPCDCRERQEQIEQSEAPAPLPRPYPIQRAIFGPYKPRPRSWWRRALDWLQEGKSK